MSPPSTPARTACAGESNGDIVSRGSGQVRIGQTEDSLTVRVVFENPWVRAGALLASLVFISLLLMMVSSVLVPLFFAFIVAYAFDPLIDIFERWRVRRMTAILGLVAILCASGLSLPLFIVPGLITEGEKLAQSAASGLKKGWIDSVLERLPLELVVDQLDALAKPQGTVESIETREQKLARELVASQEAFRSPTATATATATAPAGTLPPVSTAPKGFSDVSAEGTPADPNPEHESVRAQLLRRIGDVIKQNAATFIVSNIDEIAGAGQEVGSRAAGVVGSLFGLLLTGAVFIGNVLLFVFMTVYLLNDYDRIIAVGDDLVPPRHRANVRRIMRQVDMQLRAFFRGQGLVCLFLGVMYGAGMLFSEVPFAIPLAIFGGVVSFVPYLGLALTIGPASILTLLVHGIDWHVGGVIATFCVANFLEGNFITPKVVGGQVGLGPVWVILAIMVFGGMFGFVGLLIAVPVAAVLKVVMEELLVAYRTSAFFGPELSLADVSPPLLASPEEDTGASPLETDVR